MTSERAAAQPWRGVPINWMQLDPVTQAPMFAKLLQARDSGNVGRHGSDISDAAWREETYCLLRDRGVSVPRMEQFLNSAGQMVLAGTSVGGPGVIRVKPNGYDTVVTLKL